MRWLKELDSLFEKLNIYNEKDSSLSRYTTIGIGGLALRLVFPRDLMAFLKLLRFLADREIPYALLGGGSNLLVSDKGYEGVVISTRALRGVEILSQGETLRLRALSGTSINELIRISLQRGYGGFEFLAGVPATLGGAIKMNAGAFGKTTSSLIRKLELWHDGKILNIENHDGLWCYRAFKLEGLVLAAELEFPREDPQRVKERIKKIWQKRRFSQPVSSKTFGSVFKNPPCGFAGAMIEQVGLKGLRLGGAQISEKHANFIVNTGGAKAEEVLSLMRMAREKVYEVFKIYLEPEVKFLGFSHENPLD
ncbi:MAG: UDP-N-acetylmuramate dehydrogenase [Caldimicrobium sp.]|nr:UDP-N-acetylmuramate dehydrogenase [Caldimicrobium sp.]MCX7612958.1 UDP-N-acetylmuramate dehydrogenase [Caldimicrobium sp.]MDW8183196.1 UDP-N-acetylmuramate dehydrogenase [Caldimicrobium sp.]